MKNKNSIGDLKMREIKEYKTKVMVMLMASVFVLAAVTALATTVALSAII